MIRRFPKTSRAKAGRSSLMVMIAVISTVAAQAQSHPNERIYEYRVADYRLQPGWKTYPQGTDRALWMCFDDTAKLEISCSDARAPLPEYRFIFRIDPDKRPRPGTGGLY